VPRDTIWNVLEAGLIDCDAGFVRLTASGRAFLR